MTQLKIITSPSGARFTVASDYADKFSGLVSDLEAQGYGINPKASGGYNPRTIRGSNRPSNHAFGRAIDVNWDRNALGSKGEIPAELARSLAAKHGMTWGGDWSRPDPMHFEIAGVPNVPVSQRGIAQVAGVSQTQPPTMGAPEPMPTYKNVGGVVAPQEVARQQQLAKVLMAGGMDQPNPRHWSEALGNVLMSGVGMYKGQQAADAEAQGQAAGNQALAQMLMGGDASGALANPYSAESAQKYVIDKNTAGSKDPATVQEWKFYSALPPEQQKRFLDMKRQNMSVIGDTIYNRATGQPIGSVGDALQRGKIAEGTGTDIAKTRAELPEARLRTEMVTDNLARLKQGADTVMNAPGLGQVVGGLWQAYVPNVRQDSLNAQTDLENLKVKISGTVLQSMRDMSKTGGAVGQVTEREWPRLENMIANLDPLQGIGQFKVRLQEVIDYANKVSDQIRQAYEADVLKAQSGAPVEMPPIDVPQGGGANRAPVLMTSPEEAMRLPSGTVFVTPDGRQKVRP